MRNLRCVPALAGVLLATALSAAHAQMGTPPPPVPSAAQPMPRDLAPPRTPPRTDSGMPPPTALPGPAQQAQQVQPQINVPIAPVQPVPAPSPAPLPPPSAVPPASGPAAPMHAPVSPVVPGVNETPVRPAPGTLEQPLPPAGVTRCESLPTDGARAECRRRELLQTPGAGATGVR